MTYNIIELIKKLNLENIRLFLTSTPLLPDKYCCEKLLKLSIYKLNLNGLINRCSICRKRVSLFNSSYLKNMKLELSKFILLTYSFCLDINQHIAAELFDITPKTVSIYYDYFNTVISNFLINNPVSIGGLCKTVQIDEAVVLKRKYNRGRSVPTIWMLGGYQIGTKKAFLQIVPNRLRETIFPIIKTIVKPGSFIATDKFSVYHSLNNLRDSRGFKLYAHFSVNHSENFVDPDTSVHTNAIEGFFSKFRTFYRKSPKRRSDIGKFVDEFLWRWNFRDGKEKMFFNLLKMIKRFEENN